MEGVEPEDVAGTKARHAETEARHAETAARHADAEKKLSICLEHVILAERGLANMIQVQTQLAQSRAALQEVIQKSSREANKDIVANHAGAENNQPEMRKTWSVQDGFSAEEIGHKKKGSKASSIMQYPPGHPQAPATTETEAPDMAQAATEGAFATTEAEAPVMAQATTDGERNSWQVVVGAEKGPKTLLRRLSMENLPVKLRSSKQWGDIQTMLDEHIRRLAPEIALQTGLTEDDVIRCYQCFCLHDEDKSGKVSVTELHPLLEEISDQYISKNTMNALLVQFDKNSDGELDFEEFLFCYCLTPERKQAHLKSAPYRKNREERLDDQLDEQLRTKLVGTDAQELKAYLQKEIDEEAAFLKVPIIFLLFFFFLLSAILHRQTATAVGVEHAIRFDISENANFAFTGAFPFENGRMGNKGIDDVNSFEDFWSWLDLGLTPIFFPSGWGTSESRANVASRCVDPMDAMASMGWNTGTSKANTPYGNGTHAALSGDLGSNLCNLDKGTSFPETLSKLEEYGNPTRKPYLMFNEIVAGMRLRQEQLPLVDCVDSDLLGHAYNTPCTLMDSDRWLPPDLDSALDVNNDLVNKPGGETVYFRSGMDLANVHRHIRDLENKRWVNQQTGKVEILYTIFNNHADMFVAVYINFFIDRAGHINKIIKPVSIWLNPYSNPACYAADIVFALLVLKLFLEECHEVFRTLKENGFKKGMAIYTNFKNVVDWMSLAYSVVIFVMWGAWCIEVAGLRTLLASASVNIPGSWGESSADIYTPNNAEYWDAVDSTSRNGELFQVVLGFYPFVLGGRFFSAFSSQPRLGLVTKTLQAAANDLIHFGVVLGVTILIFCASALILFGREVEEYENFGRTYISVFRGLLGDFDFVALTEVGRLPAALWWGFFMVLVNCVMVNMLLAIIMDVYGSVKGAMNDDDDDFPTIWAQAWEIYRRGRDKRKGLRMSIQHVLAEVEKQDDMCYIDTKMPGIPPKPRLVTVAALCRMVPGLSDGQAARLVMQSVDYADLLKPQEDIMALCMSRLRAIDGRMQQVQGVLDGASQIGKASHTSIGAIADDVRRLQIGLSEREPSSAEI